MSSALKWAAVGLALVSGALGAAGPLEFEWEGEVAWNEPGSTVTWRSNLSLKGELAGWAWAAASSLADGAWTSVQLTGSGKLGEITVSASVAMAPGAPAFQGARLSWGYAWEGIESSVLAKIESVGFGWGLVLQGPSGSLLERVRLRFNLKRQLDEVAGPTFAPSFSFGEARFGIPLSCCVERVRGRIAFTKAGFEEAALSFPLPGKLGCGVSFGASLRFRTDEAQGSLFPSLVYQGPAGVDVFLVLDWDAATSALQGIKVYGFGFHGEVGNLRFRSVTSLAEDAIGLVKEPYWELLELIWKVPGCCGDGEAAVTFYFGDSGPFGLGEVEATGRIPLTAGIQLVVGFSASHAGELSVALGGKILL
ncbi:MAG: hypothetical protein BIP78_1332 [Candidatus Bipolaricaulis sibiricus]|uniref:Uncharacterized protein n=1 Tax=Bipolaricaulis sibiricus TaxID=2501609 RepID=A0A410FVX5_BIPS1|nr:MAG: hypothetical protein BIP78_1332 [Candidatus Bipolaricaulis sibiricus]